jgi:hypothetical protein
MNDVNSWVQLVIGLCGVAGMLAGALAAFGRWLLRHIDQRTRSIVADAERRLDRRIDGLESKVDHLGEKVDLRLSALETDVTIIKQRLIGVA